MHDEYEHLCTSGAFFLEPPHFPLPGSVFGSLRMIGSLLAPVRSAVSRALDMSTPLRRLIFRRAYLLAPAGVFESPLQPTSLGT
jgi:hypothetical protein